jgi:hypothetical protein
MSSKANCLIVQGCSREWRTVARVKIPDPEFLGDGSIFWFVVVNTEYSKLFAKEEDLGE